MSSPHGKQPRIYPEEKLTGIIQKQKQIMKIEIRKTKPGRTVLHVLLACSFLYGATGCHPAKNNRENNGEKAGTVQAEKAFTLPPIPPMLTSPEDRASYLVSHYWDNFDFTDTTLISKPEITEQAFVDFLDVLPRVTPTESREALTALMGSASVDAPMYLHFMELAEKYLHDPNSPFRNEEYYIPILDQIISSPGLEESYKVRPRRQLRMALKNRPGDIAADFAYTTSDGKVGRMSSVRADYLILFFNNPDCEDCKRVKEYIKDSPLFNRMTQRDASPALRILAIYPDEDLSLWKSAGYPNMVINAYDAKQVITKKELYDLKAIPTLYLLDIGKRVILKDASVEQIEAWLQAHNG